MARRSAFPRCRWSGTGPSIGEGLKVPALGADTEAVRAELEERSLAKEFSATAKAAVRLA